MKEEDIMLITMLYKIDALERVLSPAQLESYRKILIEKRTNFEKIWSSILTEEQMKEALWSFDI